LDESNDVAGHAQLIAYVRYIYEHSMEEHILFCNELPTNTTAEEIFETVNEFIISHGIDWAFCYGLCTDGAAAMTGKYSGVWARIKTVAPEAKFTHCALHRESLASKAMCPELKRIFDQIIRIVNFVKSRPLNSRLFQQLCTEMGEEHTALLLHLELGGSREGRFWIEYFNSENLYALS